MDITLSIHRVANRVQIGRRCLVIHPGGKQTTLVIFADIFAGRAENLQIGKTAHVDFTLDGIRFANGGQLSYSHAEPWANPGVLPKIAKWIFKDDAPLVFRPRADMEMITWGLKFLANCGAQRAMSNSVSLLKLGLYSKKKMDEIRVSSGIAFDYNAKGILHLFGTDADFDAAQVLH